MNKSSCALKKIEHIHVYCISVYVLWQYLYFRSFCDETTVYLSILIHRISASYHDYVH